MTPARLSVRLAIYFTVVVGVLSALLLYTRWGPAVLPFGGYDDLDLPGSANDLLSQSGGANAGRADLLGDNRFEEALALCASLVGTVVLMIPVTWVYMATKVSMGYRRAFVTALIILPICATSIVLLIQDSLALAFGLAALVAAVRFRVRLRDALDGIYVFAAVCVGLASGVGYLGVAVVMTIFLCFAAVILWALNYGANPIETAKQARKLSRLEGKARNGAS